MGYFFFEKNPSGPFCGAGGESSLEFRQASLDWPVTRAQMTPPGANIFSISLGLDYNSRSVSGGFWMGEGRDLMKLGSATVYHAQAIA